jgi:hypothetical protein
MRQQQGEPGKASSDPTHHTRKMSARFSELIDHLRHDIDEVDEPQFEAMFETAAEVMSGLVTAFRHYEKGEAAWDKAGNSQ